MAINRQLKLILLVLGCIGIGLGLLVAARYPKLWSHPVLWTFQDEKVYKFDPQDKSLKQVLLPLQLTWDTPLLSRDGRYLALVDDKALRIIRTADTALHLTILHKHMSSPAFLDGETYTPLQWSPDGNWLLIYIWRYEQRGLALLSTSSGKITEIRGINSDRNYCGFSGATWSSDSSEFVITNNIGSDCMAGGPSSPGVNLVSLESPKLASIYSGVYTAQYSSETPYQSPSGAGGPAWQPDSNWIVFSLETGREFIDPMGISVVNLYRIKADGQGAQPLTSTTGRAFSPIWDTSGEHLLFSLNETNDYEDGIYISNPDGSAPQLLIPGGYLAPISISPDGAYLAYGRCSKYCFRFTPAPGSDELWVYDFKTKESNSIGKAQFIGWQIVQE